jgi:hypothetical protein
MSWQVSHIRTTRMSEWRLPSAAMLRQPSCTYKPSYSKTTTTVIGRWLIDKLSSGCSTPQTRRKCGKPFVSASPKHAWPYRWVSSASVSVVGGTLNPTVAEPRELG